MRIDNQESRTIEQARLKFPGSCDRSYMKSLEHFRVQMDGFEKEFGGYPELTKALVTLCNLIVQIKHAETALYGGSTSPMAMGPRKEEGEG